MRTLEQFMERFEPVTESGCWIWIHGLNNKGYGRVQLGNDQMQAHRAAWVLMRGPIPNGICVLHRCDVSCCVNPSHLFLGTLKDNFHDMVHKGRQGRHGGVGVRNSHAKLTEDQVREMRRKWDERKTTVKELMAEYGLVESSTRYILRRINWRNVR